MPHVEARLFSLPLKQRYRFISIAGRECRPAQIAELTRAEQLAHRVLAAFLAKSQRSQVSTKPRGIPDEVLLRIDCNKENTGWAG
jgi:hypothetical protein